MLKWIYIMFSLALQLAVLAVIATVFFALMGPLAAFGVLVFGGINTVQFVLIEGFERPLLWWWYERAVRAAKWPLGTKIFLLLVFYCILGWFAYQIYLRHDTFELPKFSTLGNHMAGRADLLP